MLVDRDFWVRHFSRRPADSRVSEAIDIIVDRNQRIADAIEELSDQVDINGNGAPNFAMRVTTILEGANKP